MKDSFYNEAVTQGVGGEYPSILNRYLFVEKKQEKLKAQVRDASYKLKGKLVVIRRNLNLPHKRFGRDKECNLIEQYIHP